jgi:hypothetical protein
LERFASVCPSFSWKRNNVFFLLNSMPQTSPWWGRERPVQQGNTQFRSDSFHSLQYTFQLCL